MNQDERRAILLIHNKYPMYVMAFADFVDFLRERNAHDGKLGKPQEIADEFEKSKFFKCGKYENVKSI
jgi:hypothetical protein